MGVNKDDNRTTFFVQTKPEATKLQTARLFVVKGHLSGASIPLSVQSTTIGRLSDNDIVVESSSVSKVHCKITNELDDRYLIVDMGSTNGTKVNGRKLQPGIETPLIHGDTVTLCEHSFFFLLGRERPASQPGDEILIDFRAATKEADDLISRCSEVVALQKARRKIRNGRGAETEP